MDKMRMETPDLTAANVEKIGALFPNCITETADENGNLKKAINFDLLRQIFQLVAPAARCGAHLLRRCLDLLGQVLQFPVQITVVENIQNTHFHVSFPFCQIKPGQALCPPRIVIRSKGFSGANHGRDVLHENVRPVGHPDENHHEEQTAAPGQAEANGDDGGDDGDNTARHTTSHRRSRDRTRLLLRRKNRSGRDSGRRRHAVDSRLRLPSALP